MTKDQYLEMMEQLGEEPDWEKCPPDWGDFPSLVIDSMNIFHSMGDRIFPDVGYIGKDYTTYKILLKIYKIHDYEEDFVLETILWLDSRAIEASQRRLKAEYEKMKRR